MRNSTERFRFLALMLFSVILLAGTPLPAKGQGKGNRGWKEKKEQKVKKEKKQKYYQAGETPTIQTVVHQDRPRIYSPPMTGSIQKNARKYQYVYYPDINLYHNRDTDHYFWLQNGNWTSAPTMPEWARVKNLPRIELEEYYLTPYADHQWVTQTFPTGPEATGAVVVQGAGSRPPTQAPAWGYRRKYNYQYYPQANVYYNVDTKRYFWVEDGSWRIGTESPQGLLLDELTKTLLVSNSPYPY